MEIKLKIKENLTSAEAEAVIEIGKKVEKGIGFEKDPGAALSMYIEAAKAGEVKAYGCMGRIYLDYGDEKKGILYMKKGAGLGDTDAMAGLGFYYLEKQDMQNAALCFKPSAEAENPDGMYGFGRVYELCGEYGDALEWFKQAHENGQPDATDAVGRVYEEMGSPDLALFWYRQTGNEEAEARISGSIEDIEVEIEYAED